LAGLGDYLIAFKYLKSAVGIVKRSALFKIIVVEYTAATIVFGFFLTSQTVISRFAIQHDYNFLLIGTKIVLG
jgi:hypothetical protein